MFSNFVKAETIICSYPNYTDGAPVILKIQIEGSTAKVGDDVYSVLQNNNLGAVLVKSFSGENPTFKNQIDVGLFGILINKTELTMMRGNILLGDKYNTLKEGGCTK